MSYGGNGSSGGGNNTSNTTGSSNYTDDDISDELPQQKDLFAWYEAKNYDETTGFWKDSSEFGQHILQPDEDRSSFNIPDHFPRKYVSGNVTYLQFTIDTRMVFPRNILCTTALTNAYTFFHVVRRGIHGSDSYDDNGRVFQTNANDFLSGFWNVHEGIYKHNVALGDLGNNLGTEQNWCISADTQQKCFSMGYNSINNTMKRNPINGYHSHSILNYDTSIYHSLYINYGQYSGEYCDSQVAEVIFYRRVLGEADILKVLNYLERKYYGTDGTNGVGNLPASIPKCLNPNLNPADNKENLVAWYDGNSFDINKNCWKDKLGNYHISSNNIRGNIFTKKLITNDTTLISNYNNKEYIGYESPKYIYGNSDAGLRFDPCLIKGNSYTIFHVARRNPTGTNISGRIFDGINLDWYSGFENNQNGVSNNCITTNLASGGIINCYKDLSDNNYYVSHTFLTDGSFTALSNISVDALIIGGGGGGGLVNGITTGAGGGGAGGLRYQRNINLTANGIYSVIVGEGGRGGASINLNNTLCGENGSDSSFNNLISKGGGGGGNGNNNPGSGTGSGGGDGDGSGGGGGGLAESNSTNNNTKTNAEGYFANRGRGEDHTSYNAGAGGGGSGREGEYAGSNTYPNGDSRHQTSTGAEGGDGGVGKCYNIRTGQYEYYAAGGGGGCAHHRGGRRGYGGLGGGGDGGDEYIHLGKHAINNSGSGGGGASGNRLSGPITTNAGNGGNGIVIIRYQVDINSTDVSLNNSGTNYNDDFIISVDRPNYYRSIGYEKTNNTIQDISYGYINSTTINKPHLSINYGQKTDISLHAIGGEINTFKKCVKYPKVALTSASSNNCIATSSANYDSNWREWRAFNHIIPYSASTDQHTWHTSGNIYDTDTGYPNSSARIFQNVRGEWLGIEFNESFKLSYIQLYIRYHNDAVDFYAIRGPRDGIIYGSNDGNDWKVISRFENQTYQHMAPTRIYVNCKDAYSYYRLQITRVGIGSQTAQIGEMELYAETDETYTTHMFKESGEFRILNNDISNIDFLVVGGGGGGGMDMGGGGGGGGVVVGTNKDVSSNVYQVIIGEGGKGAPRPKTTPDEGIEGRWNNTQPNVHHFQIGGSNGENSYLIGMSNVIETDKITYVGVGGGAGGTSVANYAPWSGGFPGGSSGGKSAYNANTSSYAGISLNTTNISTQPIYGSVSNVSGYGERGAYSTAAHRGCGGGGATQTGKTPSTNQTANGGNGIRSDILEHTYYWGGGGGGGSHTSQYYGGHGGQGGGGAAGPTAQNETQSTRVRYTIGGSGLNRGKGPGMNNLEANRRVNSYGGDGGKNTGGGGGGGTHYNRNNNGGDGGSGIVIIRYLTPSTPVITNPSSCDWNVAEIMVYDDNLTYAQENSIVEHLKTKYLPNANNHYLTDNRFSNTGGDIMDLYTPVAGSGSNLIYSHIQAGAGGLNGTGGAQGTASASSSYSGHPPTAAFNGSLNTPISPGTADHHDSWHISASFTSPQWLSFEFPYDVIITSYKIWPRKTHSQPPKTWELRGVKHNVTYDQNNSNTYTVLDTRTNQTSWSSVNDNSIINDSERYKYYTINKSVQAGAGGLNGTGGAQGTASASSSLSGHPPTAAFNGSLNTPISPGTADHHDSWHISASFTSPQWLSFEFPYDVIITSYKIWPRKTHLQPPKTWELRGVKHNVTYDQNNSNTYTVLDTRTNQTSWSSVNDNSIINDSERYEYNFANSTSYRRYILHITAIDHTTWLSIGEFALYGTYAGNTLDAFRKYILHITAIDHTTWLSIGEFALCGIKKSNNSSVLHLPYASSELPINKHTLAQCGNSTHYSASNAFDSSYDHWAKNWSSADNKYSINTGLPTSSPEWLSYEFTEPTYVSHYNLATRNFKAGDTVPVSWDIKGSNNTTNGDDGNWELLTTEKNIVTGWKVGKFNKGFKISNPGKYKTYKFSVNRIADLIGAHETHGNNMLFVGTSFLHTTSGYHTRLRYTHATIGKLIYYSDEIINRVHIFKESNIFNLNYDGTTDVSFLIVGGGGGGGMDMGGGGGGGGVVVGTKSLKKGSYPVTVGSGGRGAPSAAKYGQNANHSFSIPAYNGGDSVFCGFIGLGGGAGGSSKSTRTPESAGSYGGSGGGESGYDATNSARDGGKTKQNTYSHITGVDGYGNDGGDAPYSHYPSGGGGAGSAGRDGEANGAHGGIGKDINILGFNILWGGGGGASGYSDRSGNGSTSPDIDLVSYPIEKYGMHTGGGGGGGGGAGIGNGDSYGAPGFNDGLSGMFGNVNSRCNVPGGDAGKNTGGGGGGGSHYNEFNEGGNGGSGIVIIKYKLRNTSHTSISNNISRGFPPELPLHNNIIGWYTPESYDGTDTWSDNSPNCNDIVVSCDDYKYLNTNNNLQIVTDTHNPGISYVKGTYRTKLDFPNTILPDGSYTLVHVARKPKDSKRTYGRIFDSKTNYNFYSGFDKLNSGVALHSHIDTSYSLPSTIRSNVNIQPSHLFTFYENLNDITSNDVTPATFTIEGNVSHSKKNGLKISSGYISSTLGSLGINGEPSDYNKGLPRELGGSWTLSFWIKIPFKHYYGGTPTILCGGTQSTDRGFHVNLIPRQNSSSTTEYAKIRYGFYSNDVDLLISNSPTNIETILQKEFVHFVLIYDYDGTYNEGTHRKIAYINGKRPGLQPGGQNVHNQWKGYYSDPFYINSHISSNSFHPSTAYWKNFAVFDRALTQEEVEIIYNQGEDFSYYDNPVTETPIDATDKDYQNNWVISVDKWNSYRSAGYKNTNSEGVSEPTLITGPHAYDGSGNFETHGDVSSNYFIPEYPPETAFNMLNMEHLAGAGGLLNGEDGSEPTTTNGYVFTSSNHNTSYEGKKAFDGVVNSSSTAWHSSETCHASYTIRDQYIGFTFPYPVTILKYRIWPRYQSSHSHVNTWRPRAWKLYGTDSENDYENGKRVEVDDVFLSNRVSSGNWGQRYWPHINSTVNFPEESPPRYLEFTVSNPGFYKCYVLDVLSAFEFSNSTTSYIVISQIAYYGVRHDTHFKAKHSGYINKGIVTGQNSVKLDFVFPTSRRITQYKMSIPFDTSLNAPQKWCIYGSNDTSVDTSKLSSQSSFTLLDARESKNRTYKNNIKKGLNYHQFDVYFGDDMDKNWFGWDGNNNNLSSGHSSVVPFRDHGGSASSLGPIKHNNSRIIGEPWTYITWKENLSDTYTRTWWGWFVPDYTGTIYFQTASDNSSLVYVSENYFGQPTKDDTVDNEKTGVKLVVDNSGTHGRQFKNGNYSVTKDKAYFIRIYYGESGGSDNMLFRWNHVDITSSNPTTTEHMSSEYVKLDGSQSTKVIFYSEYPYSNYDNNYDTFNIANPGSYKYYRMDVLQTRGSDTSDVIIDSLEYLEGGQFPLIGNGSLDGRSDLSGGIALHGDVSGIIGHSDGSMVFNVFNNEDTIYKSPDGTFDISGNLVAGNEFAIKFELPSKNKILKYEIKNTNITSATLRGCDNSNQYDRNNSNTYELLDAFNQDYYDDKISNIVSNPKDYSYYVLDISSSSDSSYAKIGELTYYDNGTYPAAGAGGLDGSSTDIGGLLLHGDASGIDGLSNSSPHYAFNNTINDASDAFISIDISEKMYPPTRNLTSASHTISGQTYGNGTYITNQSTTYDSTRRGWTAFNTSVSDGPVLANNQYNSGNYITSNNKYLVSGYYGDWITIKLPVQINLTRYGFKQRSSYAARAPARYKIYGSNDGTNWNELVYKTSTISYSSLEFYENISTTGNFNYFGLVVNKLSGNIDILNFDEWYIYGKEIYDISLKFEFPTPKTITKYKIWSQYNNKYNTPKEWTLRGCDISSNYIKTNTSTYTLLDSQKNQFPTTWNGTYKNLSYERLVYIGEQHSSNSGTQYPHVESIDLENFDTNTDSLIGCNVYIYLRYEPGKWANGDPQLVKLMVNNTLYTMTDFGNNNHPFYYTNWMTTRISKNFNYIHRTKPDQNGSQLWYNVTTGAHALPGRWGYSSNGTPTGDTGVNVTSIYYEQSTTGATEADSVYLRTPKITLTSNNVEIHTYAYGGYIGTLYAGVYIEDKLVNTEKYNNTYCNEYIVQNPGSYKNYILEIDKSNDGSNCAIGQVAYYESNFIDVSLSREPAPYLQHNLTVNNGVSNQKSDWEIGEIIVYDKELNVEEENKIVKHLKQTYCGNHNENFAIGNNNNKNISMNNVKLSVVGSMLNNDKNVQSFNHSTYTRLSDLSNVININNSTIKLVAGCGALSGTGGIDGSCNASSSYLGPQNAFNNSIIGVDDCWHSAESGNDYTFTAQWLSFIFPNNEQKYIVKYRLWPRYYTGNNIYDNWRPSSWELHGVNNIDLSYNTNDSSTYTILDIQSLPRYNIEEWNQFISRDTGDYAWKKQELNINFPDEPYYNEYFVQNPGYYDQYVLKFTNSFNWNGNNISYICISQVAYYEQTDIIDISNTTVKLGDVALAMGGDIINHYSA